MRTPRQYFGAGAVGVPPGWAGPRIRLVTFAVSTFGAFGAQAQTFLDAVARRCGRSVPGSLLDEASWATPSFAPFARAVLTLTLRRSLAMVVGESLVGDVEADRLRGLAPDDDDGDDLSDGLVSDSEGG